ncbi:MAG: alpha-glucosidase [Micropruina sp.]
MTSPWWKSAVVYQIYPRSFADSDHDGIGDLPGIVSRLDYLKQLGVDVIWLSPVYRSPQDDNGYDISDYNDIDPTFGTLADVDELIEGLHARGMKLVMDLVVNHTSDEHPWFVESRDPASDKRDWYIWRPAREGFEPGTEGAEPTNWGSFFLGKGWEFDPRSQEYYLHLFSPKQPDLNWENPAVREAIYDMMRWWVDRGVDGFRMDVINLISKTYPLVDGPVTPGFEPLCYDPSMVTDGPRVEEFLKEMNREVGIDAKELFSVGEMVMVDVEHARRYTDPANGELGMVFTFEHMSLDQQPGLSKFDLKPLHLPDLKQNLALWQDALAEVGWNSLYWNNHDQPRVVSRFGDDSDEFRVPSAKALGTVLHMLRGTPYIYQGEELGMTNAGFLSIDEYNDIEAKRFHELALSLGISEWMILIALAAKSRDNARTPMHWDDSDHAGFTSRSPWLSVNSNHREINAAEALADPDSVFYHYRRLIELRHELAIVREGRFELMLPDHERIFAYTRQLDGQLLVVVANWSQEYVDLPTDELPTLTEAELLLGSHASASRYQLEPWESRIYLLDLAKG